MEDIKNGEQPEISEQALKENDDLSLDKGATTSQEGSQLGKFNSSEVC